LNFLADVEQYPTTIHRVAFSLSALNVLQEPALRRTSPALVFDSPRRTARYRRRASERDIDITRTAGRWRWASRSPERGAQSKPDNEPAGGGSAAVYVEIRPSRESTLAGARAGLLLKGRSLSWKINRGANEQGDC